MKPENIKHTLVWAYVATGGAQVFELLFHYVLYLQIPVAEIGIYSWAAALVIFFNVAVDMGIEPILIRKFGNNEFSLFNALRVILLLRVPVIIFGAFLLVCTYLYGSLNSDEYWVLLLVGAHAVFNVFDGVSRAWLQANSLQTITNFIALLQSGLKFFAIASLSFLSLDSIFVVLLLLLLVRLLGSILLFVYANNVQRSRQASSHNQFGLLPVAGSLMRAGMSIGGISLLGAVQSRLDWLLISGLLSATSLASYALANKLYEIMQIVIGVSLTTIYPWLCKRDEKSEFHLLLLLRVIIFVGVLVSIGGILITPELISRLFGIKYFGVELPVQLMMLSAGLIAISGVFYHLALAKGFEKKLLVVTLVTTVLQLLSNLYWIPKLGIVGGAIGMLALQLSTVVGLTFLMLNNKLITPIVLMRVITFMTLFLINATLLIYLKEIAWYVLFGNVLSIMGVGWLILFKQDERSYLASHFHVLIQPISRPFSRNKLK
jgi:O-antigen/teichoic acid export membrane protein